jgi:hypothetical protein
MYSEEPSLRVGRPPFLDVLSLSLPSSMVETEVNGDSKSTNERGTYLVAWFVRAVRLVVPVQDIFFLSLLL